MMIVMIFTYEENSNTSIGDDHHKDNNNVHNNYGNGNMTMIRMLIRQSTGKHLTVSIFTSGTR